MAEIASSLMNYLSPTGIFKQLFDRLMKLLGLEKYTIDLAKILKNILAELTQKEFIVGTLNSSDGAVKVLESVTPSFNLPEIFA